MFRYFILRPEQQLFCYLYGCALALVQMVSIFSCIPGKRILSGCVICRAVLPVWPPYTRHIDRMRKPEVSPLVSIRDGIQVVVEVPRHEKARLEWEILRDDEVLRQQRATGLTGRVISRAVVYAGGDAGRYRVFSPGVPTDAIRLINAFRNMPALRNWCIRLVLSCATSCRLASYQFWIADVVAGRGLPNVFRRALLDRLPAEFCLIRRGTER